LSVPTARTVSQKEATAWETARAKAQVEIEKLAAAEEKARRRGPDPETHLVAAIAARSQFVERRPYDDELRQWINRAVREERRTYRELAVAIHGRGEMRGAVQAKQYSRNLKAGEVG